MTPDAVAESVKGGTRVWEIGNLVPGRVKPITYQIYTCPFLARHSTLLEYGKDWLAQCQDNVTEWDIGAWYQQPDFRVWQHYKVTMSVHCLDMTLAVVRM